jgi:hypothetical protein
MDGIAKGTTKAGCSEVLMQRVIGQQELPTIATGLELRDSCGCD